jgi:hypothetical protein
MSSTAASSASVDANDVPHRTEIHFAAAKGSVEEVLSMLARGAPVNEEDYDRRTPTLVFQNTTGCLCITNPNLFCSDM